MVNLWLSSELKYGKARDRQGVRGPLLRLHTFFSAHTTDNTLKSSWTWWKNCWVFWSIASLHFWWYRLVSPFHHPSTVEFFRLSIASSNIKRFKVFFSLPKLPSIDVDVQICLGVPKCPHFAPRFVLLLSVSITKKVIDMKNSYTCCGDIYDKIFVEMLMCIVGNRGDFFFSLLLTLLLYFAGSWRSHIWLFVRQLF